MSYTAQHSDPRPKSALEIAVALAKIRLDYHAALIEARRDQATVNQLCQKYGQEVPAQYGQKKFVEVVTNIYQGLIHTTLAGFLADPEDSLQAEALKQLDTTLVDAIMNDNTESLMNLLTGTKTPA